MVFFAVARGTVQSVEPTKTSIVPTFESGNVTANNVESETTEKKWGRP